MASTYEHNLVYFKKGVSVLGGANLPSFTYTIVLLLHKLVMGCFKEQNVSDMNVKGGSFNVCLEQGLVDLASELVCCSGAVMRYHPNLFK